MKSLVILTTAITFWLLLGHQVSAQVKENPPQREEQNMTHIRDKIIKEEKDALKSEVEAINLLLQKGIITDSQAEEQKRTAAEKHALNIENRLAIATNQMELNRRNERDSTYVYVNTPDDFDITIFGM